MSNKTSDKNVATEDDVRIVKAFIDYAQEVIDDMEYERPVDVTVYQKDLTSMQNILAEREQKDKRIQEIEDALLKVKDKNTTLFITCRNSIPMQVVMDKIEKNKGYLEYADTMYEYTQKDVIEECIKTLQELLEGGRK